MMTIFMAAIAVLPQANAGDLNPPSTIITDLHVVSFDGTYLRLQWTAPPWDPVNLPLGYDLKISTGPVTDSNYDSLPGDPTPVPGDPGIAGTLEDRTIDVSSLALVNTPGTVYYIGVNVLMPARKGSPAHGGVSTPNAQLACESIAPGLATAVTASGMSISSASLAWDAPHDDADSPSSSLVWRFRLYHSPKEPATFASTAAWIADPQTRIFDAIFDGFNPAPHLEYVVPGLTADATWHFVIGSLDEWSNESLSASVSATTPAMPDYGPGGGGGGNTGACSALGTTSGLALLAVALAAGLRR